MLIISPKLQIYFLFEVEPVVFIANCHLQTSVYNMWRQFAIKNAISNGFLSVFICPLEHLQVISICCVKSERNMNERKVLKPQNKVVYYNVTNRLTIAGTCICLIAESCFNLCSFSKAFTFVTVNATCIQKICLTNFEMSGKYL